jgi:dTDP-4-amino-4,6-dideoxygalactose transaminase
MAALGTGPGDEVIARLHLRRHRHAVLSGALPVLVDVTPDTYRIDLRRLKLRLPRTKAIAAVHVGGHPPTWTGWKVAASIILRGG